MASGSRQTPISFKTVPNRNKTQKWQQAKIYNYDGDDWGGYDPYDEYAYDDPPRPPVPQQLPEQYAQQQPQGYSRPAPRKNSFDQGDERRNFSAGPEVYGTESRPSGNSAPSNISGGDYNIDGRPRSRPRDFTNPEQVPPPLSTRGSPALGAFPPRKSSISSGSPAPDAAPVPAPRKEEKGLPVPPVIRPSDIYKRMEAEREKERQSVEGARPSMDSIQREADPAQQGGKPLSSVHEDFGQPASRSGNAAPPVLPGVRNMSAIGTSFLHGSSSEAEQAPAVTRAPEGKDPAAEILSERMGTRAPPGSDPAADILSERSATRAMPGSDPAADIMAERGHERAIAEPESGVEHHFSDLRHQASAGHRSLVDHAFDADSAAPSSSLSRDSSVYSQSIGGADVSRNNSSSTAGISPIMSRVPSAAAARMQQQERDRQVPTIAEEPSPRLSLEQQIPRKPSPSATPTHSRDVSAGDSELVKPGYRRSLDPPSSDNSPARTPGLENAHSRRLSQPMSAETWTAEPPAVADQGVEMMPALEPAETPAAEVPIASPVPLGGRNRAGTDFSMRESDMAREVSTSPEKNEFSPSIAQAATAEQTAFLQDHAGTPTSQWPPQTTDGRSSPGKGRVREIAGKYHTIEAESRRGSTASSKSSWSNFRGSDENLPGLRKRTTGENGRVAELGQTSSETRPGAASQMSFRPGLPGQWVSYAGTPDETPILFAEQPTTRNVDGGATLQTPQQEALPDLSPTTDKRQLTGHSPSTSQQGGFLTQAKGAGEALGASLMSTVGIGHQTRDFASKAPPAPVEQPSGHKPIGEMGYVNTPDRPELNRGDTEASMATDIASSASSVPPTPPAKDGVASLGAQRGQAQRLRQSQEESRPISNYFSGAAAPDPLQFSKSHSRDASASLDLPKLGPMTNMSIDPAQGDMESDRLRKEIVRTLSPTTSREDGAALTQDALDAPDNMGKIESGKQPEPAVEALERPSLSLLNKRFSWEERPETKGVLDSSPATAHTRHIPTVREPEPDAEIKPEMPYERPRSRQLHLVNAENEDSSDDEHSVLQTPHSTLKPQERSVVSPLTPSHEISREGLDSRDVSRDDMASSAPSPVPIGSGLEVVDSRDSDEGSGPRVPSYYIQGPPDNPITPKSPSLTQQSPVAEYTSPTSPQTAIADRSPTSPISPVPNQARTSTSGDKIPPFREILANKDTGKRMDQYKDTRQRFADTHTGLSDWLEGMLEKNPQYASLGTSLQPSASSLGAVNKGHKPSPSLAKFKQTVSSSFAAGGDGGGVRRTSTTREAASGGGAPPPPPPKDAVWEQRGKDLMKGAGALGGKAQTMGKGLLMKGRSRFGTKRESGSRGGDEKALPPVPASTPPASTPTHSHLSSLRSDSFLDAPSHASSAARSSTPSGRESPALHSRTPSTLSRTLSRLRRRNGGSRSGSGSRWSSRPASLVFLTNASAAADASRGAEANTLGDLGHASTGEVHTSSPDNVAGDGRRGGVESHWSESSGVISPWSEPAEPASQGVRGTGGVPERLGVLPSPTATAFSGTDTRNRQGSNVSGTTAEHGARRSRLDGSISEVIREGDTLEGRPGGDVTKERADNTYEELQRGWGTDSNAESATAGEGQVSGGPEYGRAFLPSQLRGVGTAESAGSPKYAAAGDGAGAEEEEMYESTPRQWHFPRQVGDIEGKEDDTPVAVKNGDAEIAGLVPCERNGEAYQGRPLHEREDSGADLMAARDPAAVERGIPMAENEMLSSRSGSAPTDGIAATASSDTNIARTPQSPVPDWDRRSEVSAEEGFHDAKEGDETDQSTRTPSRLSSVSSLGNRAAEEHMSFQAVPAGPTASSMEAQPEMVQVSQHQRFMKRPYNFGIERPVSYMPLGTTESGAPVQETLQESRRPGSASVDLSVIGGPPVGVRPYEKHPAMRESGEGLFGDHGGLRSPPPAPDTNPLETPSAVLPQARSRQVSAETRDRSSKRFSGLFKTRQPSQTTTTVYGPPPSAITDHYGLENLHTVASAVQRPGTQGSTEAPQAKRRSGIWNNLKRSSVVLPSDSRQSAVAGLPSQADLGAQSPRMSSQQPRETPPPRANTLKKPQRATTSASPAVASKKKRFSVLGSIFGRSSTTGHKTERPRKLVKQQTPGDEASQTHIPATSSVTTGYEAYEESRRRQKRQHTQPKSPQIGLPQQERADLTTAAINFPNAYPAPPGGWYAPVEEQAQKPHRVLHSERDRLDMPVVGVPEAFRPVDASYNRHVAPVGPPAESRDLDVRRSYAGSGSPASPPLPPNTYSGGPPPMGRLSPAPRHMSYGSDEYQLSPQVSGQSEYQRSGWQHHGSSPSVSPVQSRPGSGSSSPPPPRARVGSISEQMARVPRQEYSNQQQRPWAINMPPPNGDGSRRSVSSPSWAGQSGSTPQYAEEYITQDDYGYSGGPYPRIQPPKQRLPGPPYAQPEMQRAQERYPSPPYSAHARSYQPPPAPGRQYVPPPQGPQQQRYYSHPGFDGQGLPPAQPTSVNAPPLHQRSSSGYTGRRDEPALGEDSLTQMRGTSYPGQEWTPGRWD